MAMEIAAEEAVDEYPLETDVVIFNNRKGGVGKTTLSAWIATVLAALGFNVVYIDGDSQENGSKLSHPRPYPGQSHKYTLHDVVTRNVPLVDAMVQVRQNLWLIPASPFLEEASSRIKKLGNPFLLAEKIEAMKAQLAPLPSYNERLPWWNKPTLNINNFHQEPTTDEEYTNPPPYVDFVIIDSPPAEDDLTDALLRISRVLIPIKMDQFSIDGLKKRVDYINSTSADKEGTPIPLIGIFPNEIEHKPGITAPTDFLADVWRNFPDLARRPIHDDPVVRDAWAYKMTLLEYAQAYFPKSRGMYEITKLALEIAGWPGKLIGLKQCKFCAEAVNRVRAEAMPDDDGEEEGE